MTKWFYPALIGLLIVLCLVSGYAINKHFSSIEKRIVSMNKERDELALKVSNLAVEKAAAEADAKIARIQAERILKEATLEEARRVLAERMAAESALNVKRLVESLNKRVTRDDENKTTPVSAYNRVLEVNEDFNCAALIANGQTCEGIQ